MPVGKPRLAWSRASVTTFFEMFWWPLAKGPNASKMFFRIGIVGVTMGWLALVLLALVNLASPVEPIWFLVCAIGQSIGATGLMAYSHRARIHDHTGAKSATRPAAKRAL